MIAECTGLTSKPGRPDVRADGMAKRISRRREVSPTSTSCCGNLLRVSVAFVQVKSKAPKRCSMTICVASNKAGSTIDFSSYVTRREKTSQPMTRTVHVWTGERLADAAVNAGLYGLAARTVDVEAEPRVGRAADGAFARGPLLGPRAEPKLTMTNSIPYNGM